MENKTKQPEVQVASLPTESRPSLFSPRFMSVLADEVAKRVFARMPNFQRTSVKKPIKTKPKKEALGGFFLDTSAIIDGRIFDVINLRMVSGIVVLTSNILLELKHIADSKDPLKKERGRRGMEKLNSIRKVKGLKIVYVTEDKNILDKFKEVDEQLLHTAKQYKGKIITCDYNLEKKAHVMGVVAINMHALAQVLKVAAVPGEDISVTVLHVGKDKTQGVGYLDDGTMVVVENASELVGTQQQVKISRVIQTQTGKILFAKKQ
jgi:uncharacterized protein YacL